MIEVLVTEEDRGKPTEAETSAPNLSHGAWPGVEEQPGTFPVEQGSRGQRSHAVESINDYHEGTTFLLVG
jgi:hypothetical protein